MASRVLVNHTYYDLYLMGNDFIGALELAQSGG